MGSVTLACSSSAYGNIPLVEAVQRIAGIGYTAIEILAGHERSFSFSANDPSNEPIKRALANYNLSVSNIAVKANNIGVTVNADPKTPASTSSIWGNPLYIEQVKHYARLAQGLGCPSISVSPGRATDEAHRDSHFTSLITGISEVSKTARGMGVTVGVQYGPGLLINNAGDMRSLLLKCRGLKLAFHVGYSHLSCETPCMVATDMKHRLSHIHIADAGSSDRAYLIPGEGEIEWISFFKTLRWIGYQGFATVDLASYPDIPDLAARRAFYYLKTITTALNPPTRMSA